MDYLRNLGSAAASSLLQKSGITLPFSLGDKVPYMDDRTIWTLHDAIKRDDSTPVSVFFFDANQPNRRNQLPLAKNALRKLRTVRHPDVLKFIDVVETETTIYIVTERVQPLGKALAAWEGKSQKSREEWLIWGLHRITIALAFVNDSCQSTHGNVRIDSIFISPSGEWKLGGFEVLSSPKDDAAVLYTLGSLVPGLTPYTSPEVKQGGWSSIKELDPAAADAYSLGILLHSVFNPSHPLPPTTLPPHPPPAPASRGAIPPSIFPSYKRLLTPKPKPRLSPKGFLEVGMGQKAAEGAGFFAGNKLVKICASLEEFGLASEGDKAVFLRTLKESADSFPPEFTSRKVVPALIAALEYGGASANALLPLVLQLGKALPPAEFTALVVGPVVKLFASPDRGTRMALLDHLPEFAEQLDQKTVVDKVWPHLQTGFADTVAVIREATLRSIILISPKISDRILNNDLLRHLAKSQTDPEASIRTNTCILIGRLAPTLKPVTQSKMLVPAFSRALKDNFVHARVAGLMALMATVGLYDSDELASRVVPIMSFALVDKEKLVRDQAFKAMDMFVKRLEAHAASMPETAIPADTSPSTTYSAPSGQSALVSTASGAAGALAGWAMSSLNRTLVTSDMQSTMNTPTQTNGAHRPGEITVTFHDGTSRALGPPTLGAPALSAPATPMGAFPPAFSGSRGLQLGANKVPQSVVHHHSLAEELEKEASAELGLGGDGDDGGDAWGEDGGDLIDVHADAGDWSAFTSAPAVEADDDAAWGESLEAESHPPTVDPGRASSNVKIISPRPSLPIPASPSFAAAKSLPTSSRPTPAPSPSPRATKTSAGVVQPMPDEWDTPQETVAAPAAATSMAGLSKEEKALEMARRREERKQRIAQLKEKKGTKT